MPDLPIDTLFIVGLLLASFIGKLMEGKAKRRKEAPAKRPEKTMKTTGSLLIKKNLAISLRKHLEKLFSNP